MRLCTLRGRAGPTPALCADPHWLQAKAQNNQQQNSKKKVTPEKSKNNTQTNTATKTKHNRIKQQINTPSITRNHFKNRPKRINADLNQKKTLTSDLTIHPQPKTQANHWAPNDTQKRSLKTANYSVAITSQIKYPLPGKPSKGRN